MRLLLLILSLPPTVLLFIYGYWVWDNNRDVSAPPKAVVEHSLESSIRWLDKNQEILLQESNPMLWWMVQQSAAVTDDERLKHLFSRYEREVLEKQPNSLWRYVYYPDTWVPFTPDTLSGLPDYNLLLLYGASCHPALAALPIVQPQLSPGFCNDVHPLSPACKTHQTLGLRFLQTRNCPLKQNLQGSIHDLQRQIARQLTWDPRPVDVYLQRVLVLIESGMSARVKPAWLNKILKIHYDDGSWSNFHPVIPMGKQRYLGLSKRGIEIGRPHPSFHTTIQGTYLLSLLLFSEPDNVE